MRLLIPETEFKSERGARRIAVSPMYTLADAPESDESLDADGQPFIQFDLGFERGDDTMGQPAVAEVIIIPESDVQDIVGFPMESSDGAGESEWHYCCRDEYLGKTAGCMDRSDVDKLIINRDVEGLKRYPVEFGKDDLTATTGAVKYDVTITGIHTVLVAMCDDWADPITWGGSTAGDVNHVIAMNPFGYLPGDMYGFLPFYGWMSLLYLSCAFIWFAFNACYWKDLLYVQNCITGVLFLCLVEMAVWYFDYKNLNTEGVRHTVAMVTGMIFSVARRSVSRMLVTAVSWGYGVVKPTLGGIRKKIILLGSVYFIFAFAFECLISYNQTNEVPQILRMVLAVPVAVLDGIFWWWIFVSLHRTVQNLEQRRQTAKLALYKKFTYVLGTALVVALIFAVYQMYYVYMLLYTTNWDQMWFMDIGFWQMLYTAVFIAVMVLWRPSQAAKRYAYAQQLSTEDKFELEAFDDDLSEGEIEVAGDTARFAIDDDGEDETVTKMS